MDAVDTSKQCCDDEGLWKVKISKRMRRLEFIMIAVSVICNVNSFRTNFLNASDFQELRGDISQLKNNLRTAKIEYAAITNKLETRISKVEKSILVQSINDKVDDSLESYSSSQKRMKSSRQLPENEERRMLKSELPNPQESEIIVKPLDDYIGTREHLMDRRLQSFFEEDYSGRCNMLPILSPINNFSNFTFDSRVDRALMAIRSVSPLHSLQSFVTPQYKAACWILYDDAYQLSSEDTLFIQRYILAIFFFATGSNGNNWDLDSVCEHEIIECNNDGEITMLNATLGLPSTIPTELSYLHSLEHLILKGMRGILPPDFGRLNNLKILNLDDSNLSGTIPPEIGNLSNLRELKLYKNSFEGTIPTEIGYCTELTYVNLTENNLGGTIPSELFQCTNMQVIDLIGNHLTGTMPTEIHQLQNLTYLRVNNNKMTGQIPSEVGLLSDIEKLWMGFNQFTGTLPPEIAHMESLEWLILNDNKITGPLPDIFDKSYFAISLAHNQITGSIPFKSFENEKYFAMLFHENKLTGNVPDEFCSNVVNFKVDDSSWFLDKPNVECSCCDKSDCHLWETAFSTVKGTSRPLCPQQSIQNITFFEEYWITDLIADVTIHEFHGEGILSADICLSPTGCYTMYDDGRVTLDYNLSYSASEKSLVQNHECDAVEVCGSIFDSSHPKRNGLNHLTQLLTPDDFNDLSSGRRESLCWIMTNDTRFDDYYVCDGTLLQRFVLATFYQEQPAFAFNEFSSKHTCEWPGIECDKSNRFVESIHLPNDHLFGTLMTEIGLLTRLKSINFNGNDFTGTIAPSMFTNLPNLEVFDVGSNKLAGKLHKVMFDAPQLKALNLSHNLLVSTLPQDAVFPESLETIDLEDNLLQGSIPHNLLGCQKLKYINLSKNSFRDHIPSKLGGLENLQILKLNENRFFGSIPVNLFDASQLSVLMLQSNQLTGSIPTQIGLLTNVTEVSASHNILKGKIPTQFENLQKIELLHLHQNRFTGSAPTMVGLKDGNEINQYITDCGQKIDFEGKLTCDTCSMCCDSLGECQINIRSFLSQEVTGYILVGSLVPILISFVIFLAFQLQKKCGVSVIFDDRNSLSVFNEDSVNCLIFANNGLAWAIYVFISSVQGWLFANFLKTSNFDNEDTDWRFSFVCPGNSMECSSLNSTSNDGWVMFVLVTLLFLGTDFVDSLLQLRKAITQWNLRFFISGFVLFFLTVLAFYTTIVYNWALAESNTDLIVNTVILLFINDLDEQCLNILDSLVPFWIANRYVEIEEWLEGKANGGEKMQGENKKNEESRMYRRSSFSSRLLQYRFHGFRSETSERSRKESGKKMLGFGRSFGGSDLDLDTEI